MTSVLGAWKILVDSLDVNSDLKSAVQQTKNYLTQTKNLINNLSDAVNSLSPSSSLLQATIDDWKADI